MEHEGQTRTAMYHAQRICLLKLSERNGLCAVARREGKEKVGRWAGGSYIVIFVEPLRKSSPVIPPNTQGSTQCTYCLKMRVGKMFSRFSFVSTLEGNVCAKLVNRIWNECSERFGN